MLFARAAFRRLVAALGVLCALTLGAINCHSENFEFQSGEFRLESAGVRYGFSANERNEDFEQAEAFVNWELPFRLELCWEWRAQARWDTSLGWLGGEGDNAAIATVGPSVILERSGVPVSFEAGASPSFLTRDQFGSKDFGTIFQFTSHAGVNLDLGNHLRLSYRIQHMSNAHLSSSNPGLNMHAVAVSWRF